MCFFMGFFDVCVRDIFFIYFLGWVLPFLSLFVVLLLVLFFLWFASHILRLWENWLQFGL